MTATTIKLGKTKYKVRFSFQAIRDIEDAAGVNLMTRGPYGLDTRQFSVFVWGAIEPDKNGSKPSLDDVQNQLDLPTIRSLHDSLMEAWADAFPIPDLGSEAAGNAYEVLKSYFRVPAKSWVSDPRAFQRIRSCLDIIENAQADGTNEASEPSEGNADGTGQ